MPNIKIYNRDKAVSYAHKWAFGRNPAYYKFDADVLGGDCTNFVSQCLYAGSGVMNYRPIYGWYYISGYKKSPSWTAVRYLYKFLVDNKGAGPFGRVVEAKDIKPGDVVQISFSDNIYHHTTLVVQTGNPASINNILVAAHTNDSDNRALTSYPYEKLRFIHIDGVRY